MVQNGRQNVNTADDIVPLFPQKEGQGPPQRIERSDAFPSGSRQGRTHREKQKITDAPTESPGYPVLGLLQPHPATLYKSGSVPLQLDTGETEALSIMEEKPWAIFLTDDASARLVAEPMHYKVHGTRCEILCLLDGVVLLRACPLPRAEC